MIMTVLACIATVASCIFAPDYATACPRVNHQVFVQQAPEERSIHHMFVDDDRLPRGRNIIFKLKTIPPKKPETYIVE